MSTWTATTQSGTRYEFDTDAWTVTRQHDDPARHGFAHGYPMRLLCTPRARVGRPMTLFVVAREGESTTSIRTSAVVLLDEHAPSYA